MLPEYDRGRPGEETASKMSIAGDTPNGTRFTGEVLADAFRSGQRRFWLKRADDFRRAKPIPGEFHGNATCEQLNARWSWLDEIERACRAKADLCSIGGDSTFTDLLADVRRAA